MGSRRPGSLSKGVFAVVYTIPSELVKGKQKVTVRFQTTGRHEAAGVLIERTATTDS